MTVESPCLNICTLDRTTRTCTACLRTLEEIGSWGRMTDAEKRRVLDRIAAESR